MGAIRQKKGAPAKCGLFQKVSPIQFRSDMLAAGYNSEDFIAKAYDEATVPCRATTGSAGYDIVAPFSFTLKDGEEILIPTGLRVLIDDGWFLSVLPRSGLGFKYRFQLANSMGVIDSDYFGAANEGHIMLKMMNDNRKGKELYIEAGKAIAQGIFLSYGVTKDDSAGGERIGGFGSTNT